MKLLWRRGVPALAALIGIALTVSLGNWQTRRAAEKLAAQQAIDAAGALPPLALAQALAAGSASPAWTGRRVSAVGRFLSEQSVYIDNRSYKGQAGFHVLTPFVSEGLDQPVLVLRGWVPQDPARRSVLPAVAEPSGAVIIEALVHADLEQTLELGSQTTPQPGERLWQNASIDKVARWTGLVLAPVVLRQLTERALDEPSAARAGIPPMPGEPAAAAGQASVRADQASARAKHAPAQAAGLQPDMPGSPPSPEQGFVPVRDWPSPGGGVDKHRAYAFQWYSMAILIAGLWIVLAWRQRQSHS